MIQPLPWVAVVASALLAGGGLYATLVEHPARMACGPPMALAHFRRSHPRWVRFQTPLAILGSAGALGTWLGGGAGAWLAAGLVLGLVLPLTRVAIEPTSRRLLDHGLAPDAPEARRLLHRWGYLHLARTVLGLVALWLTLWLQAGG